MQPHLTLGMSDSGAQASMPHTPLLHPPHNTELVALVCRHQQLCEEDPNWWWPAFHRAGSPACGVLAYAVVFAVRHLPDLRGPGLLLYAACTAATTAAAYFCLGTVGVAASCMFVSAICERLEDAEMRAEDAEAAEKPGDAGEQAERGCACALEEESLASCSVSCGLFGLRGEVSVAR